MSLEEVVSKFCSVVQIFFCVEFSQEFILVPGDADDIKSANFEGGRFLWCRHLFSPGGSLIFAIRVVYPF